MPRGTNLPYTARELESRRIASERTTEDTDGIERVSDDEWLPRGED